MGERRNNLNHRLDVMPTSATMAINSKAQLLKQQGQDIINLTVGELSFPTPANVLQATKDAIDEGFTKYGPIRGITELRQAVAEQTKCQANDVLITVGAKQALYNVFQTIINPVIPAHGEVPQPDEVIIFAPYWVSYPPFIQLAGGVTRFANLNPETGYQIDVNTVRGLITPQTKAILLNTPSNPTGAVQSQETLDQLWLLCKEKNIYLILDEIYQHLIFDQEHTTLTFEPNRKLIIVDGVSKGYLMTGFRIGWVVANEEVISNIAKLQSHSTASPTTFCQYAAFEALTSERVQLTELLRENRDLVVERLNAISGVTCSKIDAAFYAFPSFRGYVGKKVAEGKILSSSRDLAEFLLEDAKVATVPGVDFGADWHLRINFAVSKEELLTALTRIEESLGKLV